MLGTTPLTIAGGVPFIPDVNQSADLATELSLASSEVKAHQQLIGIIKDHNMQRVLIYIWYNITDTDFTSLLCLYLGALAAPVETRS